MINNQIVKFLEVCKGIVINTSRDILIVNMMGEYRAYLTSHVVLKSNTGHYSEVRDAQDITTIVHNVGINFATGINDNTLLEKTQSIHKEDFKFGTDDYIWITKISLNS